MVYCLQSELLFVSELTHQILARCRITSMKDLVYLPHQFLRIKVISLNDGLAMSPWSIGDINWTIFWKITIYLKRGVLIWLAEISGLLTETILNRLRIDFS